MTMNITYTQHTNALDYAECHYDECHYDECHYDECHYDESHYDECHYDECHYDECSICCYSECRYTECHYAKFCNAECHYGECRYDDCRGTSKTISPQRSELDQIQIQFVSQVRQLKFRQKHFTKNLSSNVTIAAP